jgi:tripartite-type tricarboxylate transporter receptor subunit TctC
MKLVRRNFLALAGAAIVAPGFSRVACTQTYPARPVHVIVGFPPGSTADTLARLLGQSLAERLGQPFIIENRPGAGSNIATESVVRAAPDGYTLLFVTSPNAVNATFYDNLKFNFIRDITLVSGVGRGPFIMVVNPSLPAKTVPEFIAYAKANTGKINMASSGNGTTTHVAGELLKMMAGIDMVHVPYRGDAPALTDLLAGQVQMMFVAPPPSIEHIRTGRLCALAVTSAARLEALPNVPTLAEFVPGFEASSFQGIGAPKDMPPDIIQRLSKEIMAALAESKMKARISDLGGEPLPMTSADFGKLVTDETEKWGKVIRVANIKPD